MFHLRSDDVKVITLYTRFSLDEIKKPFFCLAPTCPPKFLIEILAGALYYKPEMT